MLAHMANVHILTFSGELDISCKPWIVQELGRIEHFGPDSVTILEMTDVRYVDSTFLNALVAIQKQVFAGMPGGRICIVAHRTHCFRPFQITRLDRIFPMFADITLARSYAEAAFASKSVQTAPVTTSLSA